MPCGVGGLGSGAGKSCALLLRPQPASSAEPVNAPAENKNSRRFDFRSSIGDPVRVWLADLATRPAAVAGKAPVFCPLISARMFS